MIEIGTQGLEYHLSSTLLIACMAPFPTPFPFALLCLEWCREPGGADSGGVRSMSLQLPQDTRGDVGSVDGHGQHLTQHQLH